MAIEDKRAKIEAGMHKWYPGWLHLGSLLFLGGIWVTYCLRQLSEPRWYEWAMLLPFFLINNYGEYKFHRVLTHHRIKGLELFYKRHTLSHHVYYTADKMGFTKSYEMQLILFPWLSWIFMMLLVAPLAGLWYGLGSLIPGVNGANLAWLFWAEVSAYFFLYEMCHTVYHLRGDHPVAQIGLVKYLRNHHQVHHDPKRMKWNFNITFPIFDMVFGTVWKPESAKAPTKATGEAA